jgi:hypothetical protein
MQLFWLRTLTATAWRVVGVVPVDAENSKEQRPWAVLITGLNGIRKTTAVYQPWFAQVLREALGGAYVRACLRAFVRC